MSFLDDIPDLIADALGDDFLDAVLTRETVGAPDPATPWEPGAVTTTSYPCKAINDEWASSYLAGGLVNAGDCKVLVLASTLIVEPAPGDRITVRDETFTVVPEGRGQPAVSTDPAKATWTLRASR
ncbi:hypothetical protein SAMN02745157_4856 [Kaistia soli DSM 19436]|uniref:Phage Head-Tail Attachment n=1 Tax=Kaistia soli DSM 19436 TaxID=1122133 RepID=A0A1M5MR21_9HYPH|nr:hypothetical protein [Kaistia soli]SHG79656.1 hypothetical protein SAMN02745157_4856 [Kaistia soli DSM 19436]